MVKRQAVLSSAAYGTCAAAVRGFLARHIQIQRVAGMCKPGKYDSQRRFTSVAIRCDTSEETRI
ncbi:hypothetical protein CDL31_24765 [Enterobacter kobei]|nr:hypothetical protein CDL31_24765 [Enterobacter kobei]